MENIFNLKNIIIYIIAINLITFLEMGIDKWKAKKEYWRTPEKTLFILVLLGGGIGGIAGMHFFRHKTKKMQFRFGFPAILIIEIVCIILYLLTLK